MSFVAVIALAIGLAMDSTAVAIAVSIMLGDVSGQQVFRLAFHFGLFQAAMPAVGWFAGRTIGTYIQDWDHWVAFGLLALVGVKGIVDALRRAESNADVADPTTGARLIVLSVAASIDALAVGLSLALLRVAIWYPAAVVGLVTAAMTACGMLLGSRLGRRFGQRVRIVGGVILIAIGIKIVIDHTIA